MHDVCTHVCKIIHSLKLVDYLQVQADKITYINDEKDVCTIHPTPFKPPPKKKDIIFDMGSPFNVDLNLNN